MFSKLFRGVLFFAVAVTLLNLSSFRINAQAQTSTNKTSQGVNAPAVQTGTIYSQPVDPNGKLLLSSWLTPDGSDNDQYVWDNFTLQSNGTITEIDWFGVYDSARSGAGGPVLDFNVSIFPSTPAGTEPAVANPPLVQYQTGGNAAETSSGTIGGSPMYAYKFSLPTPFIASAGVKYWVQIEASQQGSIPDWCLVTGSGGDSNHFRRIPGAGGDVLYRVYPGDSAFTLVGSLPDATPTPPTATTTSSATDIPTASPTNTSTPTPTPMPQIPACFSSAILVVMALFLFRAAHR
jgi:hypothetical protein